MFSTSDTIVAIATPPGRGGIGVVRISGPEAHQIAQSLTAKRQPFEPRHATLTTIRRSEEVVGSGLSRTFSEAALDQAVVTYFPSPHSFTGDDVIELSAHGSPVVLRGIVTAAIGGGARLAEPGEFT